MKILVHAYSFRPNIGGIEEVTELLTEELRRVGHEVRVVTQTPGDSSCKQVVRRPGLVQLLRNVSWSEVSLQSNLTLRTLLPTILLRRRTVIVHHTWIGRSSGPVAFKDRLKLWIS